ncbi:hypothetical protein ACIQXV_20565 [Neobacillus sp. NPDC097160]|uniref:hypothetical protein n=1 Tax=Neobacillus sp. NPDC097160 TaxID=3364298 RepID=UPI00380DE6C2
MAVMRLVVPAPDLDQEVQTEVDAQQIVFHQVLKGNNPFLGMVTNINKLPD